MCAELKCIHYYLHDLEATILMSLHTEHRESIEPPRLVHIDTKDDRLSSRFQKTVVALLDQMVIPHWPYLPQRKDTYDTDEEEEGIEGAWSTITDDPLSYHFYYHILDGDEGGRPPKIIESVEDKQIDNKYFSLKDKSCLHLIAKSKHMVG